MTRFRVFLIGLAFMCNSQAAFAQARFINLSDEEVFVASSFYSQGSTQPDVTVAGWSFSGWYKIAPGTTWESPAGNYYVKCPRGPITLDGRNKSVGYIADNKFDVKVPRDGSAQKGKELLEQGYQQVEYQQLGNGIWKIPGVAYRLQSKEFSVNISSRSIKFLNEPFKVPGPVSYYTTNVQGSGTKDIKWSIGQNRVTLMGSVQGEQKRPFGEREPGYVRGTITVHYIEPVR